LVEPRAASVMGSAAIRGKTNTPVSASKGLLSSATPPVPRPPANSADRALDRTRWCSWPPTLGFAPAGSPSNPRAPRALVNPTDKVPLHWNRTSPATNTPTSRKNTASTTNE